MLNLWLQFARAYAYGFDATVSKYLMKIDVCSACNNIYTFSIQLLVMLNSCRFIVNIPDE